MERVHRDRFLIEEGWLDLLSPRRSTTAGEQHRKPARSRFSASLLKLGRSAYRAALPGSRTASDPPSALAILHRAAAAIPGCLAVYDVERGRLSPLGTGWRAVLTYSPEELAALSAAELLALVHREDRDQVQAFLARVDAMGDADIATCEALRVRLANGRWHRIKLQATIFARDADRPRVVLASATPVDAVQADTALDEEAMVSEPAVLSALLENVPEGLVYSGGPPAYPVIAHSRAAGKLFGKVPTTMADLAGGRAGSLYCTDAANPSPLEQVPPCRAWRFGESVSPEEWILRRPDGGTVSLEVAAVPVRCGGTVIGSISSWRDAGDRRHLEEALRERAEQFAWILRSTQTCWWSWALDSDTLSLSDECRALLSWPREHEASQENLLAAVHAGDRARVARAFQRGRDERSGFELEFRVLRDESEERWIRLLADFHFDDFAKPLCHFGVMADVTARKRAEGALRESEERFRQLAEGIDEIFWVLDPVRRKWVYVSPAYTRLFGFGVEDPESWLRAIQPEDRERVERVVLAGEVAGPDFNQEYRIRTPRGTRWMHHRGVISRDAAGHVMRMLGVTEDVTERKPEPTGIDAGVTCSADERPRVSGDGRAKLLYSHRAIAREIKRLSQSAGSLAGAAKLKQESTQLRRTQLRRTRLARTRLQRARIDCAKVVERALRRLGGLEGGHADRVDVDMATDVMPLFADGEHLADALASLILATGGLAPAATRIAVRAGPRNGVAVVRVSLQRGETPEGAESATEDLIGGLSAAMLDGLLDQQVVRSGKAGELARLAASLDEVRRVATVHGGTLVIDRAGDAPAGAFTLRLPLARRGLAPTVRGRAKRAHGAWPA